MDSLQMDSIKKLSHYDVFEVIDTFNIKKNRNCSILKNGCRQKVFLRLAIVFFHAEVQRTQSMSNKIEDFI